ncbi:hypothetical protein SAMN05421823_103711 [Catalinimonas alkaloidigena]|uniref:DUF4369 domain-containing protein n=1 Tax=Catalinimonas alkaloidigena TaxID=1075417 RepID=A0A1G9F912_9BACT|nr:hypothetical protein [Catalinimonas alkaloidigena]SDK84887.1 hypothetical protein SAMN05421823_103711 [Catalinimonas alkaloidigena]
MKKWLLTGVGLLLAFASYAQTPQDVIVTNKGKRIKGTVQLVNIDEVRYTKEGDASGAVYTMKVGELDRIDYANGTQDLFIEESPTYLSNTTDEEIK